VDSLTEDALEVECGEYCESWLVSGTYSFTLATKQRCMLMSISLTMPHLTWHSLGQFGEVVNLSTNTH